MPARLRDSIISELSTALPSELVIDFIESYERTLVEFRKGAWDETLWKAGKFVENVFRLLYFVRHSKLIAEVPNINDLKKELEQSPAEKFTDSVRILIPRISTAMIYDPRSKKGAVHVKPLNPDYIDATLGISACDWVVAEMIRVFHTNETSEIQQIIASIVTRKVPFVEKHGTESYVTIPLGSFNEILMLLLDSHEGMDRLSIGKSLKNSYSPSTITEALQELIKKRFAILRSDGKYAITGPGELEVSRLLSTIT